MRIMSECRLCLEIGPPIGIFDESKPLSEKIQDCCGVTTSRGDGLPDQICFKCEMKLNSFFEFKQTCVKNHIILIERYKEMTDKIADTKISIHIYDRSDLPNSPDVCDDVDEKFSLEDIKPKISEATRISKDVSKEPMSNFLLSDCRLCLKNEIPIYIFDESKFLPEKIMEFCGLMIMQNDGLPDHICFSCEMKLNAFIEFKQTCLKNYIILKERHSEITGEIVDFKNSIDVFDRKDVSNSLNSDLHIDEKYSIENIKITHESEAAWIDYLSRDSTHQPVIKKKYQCDKCDYKTSSERFLHRHIKNIHLNKTYECDKCYKILKSKKSLLQHLKLHMNSVERKYRCDKCNYKTDYKNALVGHMENKHLNKTYECNTCHKILKRKNSLQQHLKLHMNTVKVEYQCDKCDYKTYFKNLLVGHIDNKHLNKTYECDTCHKIFKCRFTFLNHRKLHMNNIERKFQCDKCDYKTNHKVALVRHIENKHLNNTYECDTCHKILKSKYSFIQHRRLHSNNVKKIFQCDNCDFKANFESVLVKHFENKHFNKTYECDICHKILKNKFTLLYHRRLHMNNIEKKFQCDECDYKTIYKNSLVAHIEKHLNNKYNCDTCHKIFKNRFSFRLHLKRHMNDLDNKYQCDICDYKTYLKFLLVRHVQNKHSNKTYKCDSCYKILKSKSALMNHRRLHTDDIKKNFQCDECDYKTIYKNALVGHIENKHLNKTYECDTCHKIFKNKASFKLHVKLHLKYSKKLYQCDECDYKTVYKNLLVGHIHNKHLNTTYECDTCHEILKTEVSFKLHLKLHLNNLEKLYKCVKCDYKTNYKYVLVRHVEYKHMNKSYECDLCHKMVSTIHSLQRHLKLHVNNM